MAVLVENIGMAVLVEEVEQLAGSFVHRHLTLRRGDRNHPEQRRRVAIDGENLELRQAGPNLLKGRRIERLFLPDLVLDRRSRRPTGFLDAVEVGEGSIY